MNWVNVLDNNLCTGIISGGIPEAIGKLVHIAYLLILIAVPVMLVLWGALDFAKGVIGQDEDKIKAGQKKFIQRLIAAAIVFLIVSVVNFVIKFVSSLNPDGADTKTVWDCARELINGNSN